MEQRSPSKTEGFPLACRIPFELLACGAFVALLLLDVVARGVEWLPVIGLGLPALGFAVCLVLDLRRWGISRRVRREGS